MELLSRKYLLWVLIISFLTLLVAGVTMAKLLGDLEKQKVDALQENGLLFAKSLAASFYGWYDPNLQLTVDSSFFDPGVFVAYEQHYRDLESKDEQVFNMTQWLESESMSGSEIEAMPDLDSIPSDEEDTEVPDSDIEDIDLNKETFGMFDPRLFDQNGDWVIRVNDLHFNDEGWDVVVYDGSEYVISKSLVPITFEMMKNDLDYHYNFKDSFLRRENKSSGFFDATFASSVTQKPLLVRLYFEGYKFTRFEVRQ
jgi:hypothetical protein